MSLERDCKDSRILWLMKAFFDFLCNESLIELENGGMTSWTAGYLLLITGSGCSTPKGFIWPLAFPIAYFLT